MWVGSCVVWGGGGALIYWAGEVKEIWEGLDMCWCTPVHVWVILCMFMRMYVARSRP